MSYLFEVYYDGVCIAVRAESYERLFQYLKDEKIEPDEIKKIHQNIDLVNLIFDEDIKCST